MAEAIVDWGLPRGQKFRNAAVSGIGFALIGIFGSKVIFIERKFFFRGFSDAVFWEGNNDTASVREITRRVFCTDTRDMLRIDREKAKQGAV